MKKEVNTSSKKSNKIVIAVAVLLVMMLVGIFTGSWMVVMIITVPLGLIMYSYMMNSREAGLNAMTRKTDLDMLKNEEIIKREEASKSRENEEYVSDKVGGTLYLTKKGITFMGDINGNYEVAKIEFHNISYLSVLDENIFKLELNANSSYKFRVQNSEEWVNAIGDSMSSF